MELRHLIYFEAVARHQNVSRAAEELSVAQPAITKQIHDLEKELAGGPLFEKVGRNLRLNEAGKAFLIHTRQILAQVEVARAEMREMGEVKRGKVSVGAPPGVGETLLPSLLADFHKLYPAIELHLYEDWSRPLLKLLDAGEIDLALVTLPVSRRGLRLVPLFSEELVALVSPEHPLAQHDSITIAELEEEPFLLYPTGYVREMTLMACRNAGFEPNVMLNGGSVGMLLRLAEVGLGVAIMPQLVMQGGNKRLKVLPITNPVINRTIALASYQERGLTPAALALRSYIEKQLLDKLLLFNETQIY